MSEKELRRYSRVVVDGDEQAPSRAMLRAVGFDEDDFQAPADRHRINLEHGDAVQYAHWQSG